MTPEEAIRELEKMKNDLFSLGYLGNPEKENEIFDMAIKALEEIQQYREIGTVEECREAREKQVSVKPKAGAEYMIGRDDDGNPIWDTDYACAECGMGIAGEYVCCPYCGQQIDWS